MHTLDSLKGDLKKLDVDPRRPLFVHSSMKALGPVAGGVDAVLDAFIGYMTDALLIFPTHTWRRIPAETTVFDPATEPSCVGILSETFRHRDLVVRSHHPTHSVAALGPGAKAYVADDDFAATPCPRDGTMGKLIDMKGQILFVGCPLTKNTFIHGVEEWAGVTPRVAPIDGPLEVRLPDGGRSYRSMCRHYHPVGDISERYGKLEAPLRRLGVAVTGRIGDARSVLCDAAGMAEVVAGFLSRNPDLFLDDEPVPRKWYGG